MDGIPKDDGKTKKPFYHRSQWEKRNSGRGKWVPASYLLRTQGEQGMKASGGTTGFQLKAVVFSQGESKARLVCGESGP